MSRYGVPNLLDEHPEGLGKLIEVYPLTPNNYKINGNFIKENLDENRMPFLAELDGRVYLIILGESLTGAIPHEYDVSFADELVKVKLKSYVDKIWEYLVGDLDTLIINCIGWQK